MHNLDSVMTGSAKRVPENYRRLFDLHLPGYDPIATAEDYEFYPQIGEVAVSFIHQNCTHVEGPKCGQPFILEPWQIAIVACVYGWFHPDTQERRYLEVWQYVPRGNGKTTLLGALVNLMGMGERHGGGQLYSAASDRLQASLVFRQSKLMAEASPLISQAVTIRESYRSIQFPRNTVYRALAADAKRQYGQNPSFVVVDEVHNQPDDELMTVLRTGTSKRVDALFWMITTADYDRESICNRTHEYAMKVRDGVVTDARFLPVIYEADREADWTDPKVWAAVNPNLGVSIQSSYLERECKKAQDQPSYENHFKRLHLNMKTQSFERWIDLIRWDANNAEFDSLELVDMGCWGGLDVGATSDLTSLCLLFPVAGGGVAAKWIHWCPEDTIKLRSRRDKAPYEQWHREGWLRSTPGNETDYDLVELQIAEACADAGCYKIAADRYFQAAQLCQRLAGIHGIEIIFSGLGYRDASEPSKEFDRLVNRGEFFHGSNPMLRWMASHVIVERNGDNLKPTKEKSPEKIDGIISAVLGLAVMIKDVGLGGFDDGEIVEVTDDDPMDD